MERSDGRMLKWAEAKSIGGSRVARWLESLAPGVVAAISAPFLITGIYRAFESIPTFLPIVIFVGGGLALILVNKLRAVGVGLAVGALLHWMLLLYLFSLPFHEIGAP